ncbi:MAG TPA: hypothetical protein PLK28_03885 [Candidatus Rifleibacterium sp.]|jgi:hypothetical protein|nr:hypothetical protein [Candidatus Rifleibacterium sp.]HPW58596.1 hypothetical protein [Candidatus Rifleibacterium sp.]HQB84398.1 hypothetical protein [Candidatus Rifleibacterium sp.]
MNNRRGFTIFFLFLVIMVVLFGAFFAQTSEMISVGRLQSFYLKKYASLSPVVAEVSVPLSEEELRRLNEQLQER